MTVKVGCDWIIQAEGRTYPRGDKAPMKVGKKRETSS